MLERFTRLPSALEARARWVRMGRSHVPAMLVHPDWDDGTPVPVVVWIHGRTVQKEVDPGRYLRWMRAGIGTCAVDLPGHGERFDAALHEPDRAYEVVLAMLEEIDEVVDDLREIEAFDTSRLAIGGMSAGGMAVLARLCSPHPFCCASVEATSGSWAVQRGRAMFRDLPDRQIAEHDPIRNLDHWDEIPLQAIHSRADEWVAFEGQEAFVDELRRRYADPDLVELVVYDRTGAPYEHAGFGRMSADAKDRQRDFFVRRLFT